MVLVVSPILQPITFKDLGKPEDVGPTNISSFGIAYHAQV